MIQALIFDLDGTLVQTEKLKATSYAIAVKDLCAEAVPENEIMEAYKQVVGSARAEVSRYLVKKFHLNFESMHDQPEFKGLADWQILIQVRLARYDELISDPSVLQAHCWPYNVEVLEAAHNQGCKTALATMSSADRTRQVLRMLGLEQEFTFIATKDDVEVGKPDPEIYQLLIRELELKPNECLVLEDSPAGIRSAKAAGTQVIAVTTPFTHDRVHELRLLDPRWIIDEPGHVMSAVQALIADSQRERT